MNTLKNFAFGMCLCGTFGLGLTLLGSCTSSGGKTETVMSDSVDAEQGNAVVEAIMSRRSIRKYKDQPVEREKLGDESIYFMMTTRFYDGDPSNNVLCWDNQEAHD